MWLAPVQWYWREMPSHEMGVLHPSVVGTQYENVLVKHSIKHSFTRTVCRRI